MNERAAGLRLVLFAAVVALLLGAAITISGDMGEPEKSSPARHAQVSAAAIESRQPAFPSGGLDRTARKFLRALLSSEVGSLRAGATGSFAAELLADPRRTRAAGRSPVPPFRLQAIPLPGRPPRALVSGTIERPGGPEQFSFLFIRTDAGWLASGPGE